MVQVVLEDQTKNRLRESLALFEDVISSPWLSQTAIILYLNNADLFYKKIQRSHLATYFPEYKGLFPNFHNYIMTLW